ncbi:MAG: cell division protein SepF [Candidatus Woesearchaeota archaeon]
MRSTFAKIKDKILGPEKDFDIGESFGEEDYIEIDTKQAVASKKNKILVKPYTIRQFDDVKEPINALREGYTIALLNIKSLKDKDMIELKRVVNKVKKTCDAIGGDIAGFGEDWIVATPSFAEVFRSVPEQVK